MSQELILKGDWSAETEALLNSSDFDTLILFGINWSDYSNLLAFADKIKVLKVPLGPDSTKGIEGLTELVSFKSNDRIKPKVDFRQFQNLKFLEINVDTKYPVEFLANEQLKSLTIDGAGLSDFGSLASLTNLESLTITKGNLTTTNGIESLSSLKELSLIKCSKLIDIANIHRCSSIESINIESCSKLMKVNSLFKLPKLKVAEVEAKSAEPLKYSDITSATNLQRLICDVPFLDLGCDQIVSISAREIIVKTMLDLNEQSIVDCAKKLNKDIENVKIYKARESLINLLFV